MVQCWIVTEKRSELECNYIASGRNQVAKELDLSLVAGVDVFFKWRVRKSCRSFGISAESNRCRDQAEPVVKSVMHWLDLSTPIRRRLRFGRSKNYDHGRWNTNHGVDRD